MVGTAAGHGTTTPSVAHVSQPSNLTALVLVVALVALGAIIEVVGHELVGFRHTLRAVGKQQPD